MKLSSKYSISYSVNGDEESQLLELVLKQKQGLNKGYENVYLPELKLNGFITNEYDEILIGCVNTKFILEEIADSFKKELKSRYRTEKKNFRLIKENLN